MDRHERKFTEFGKQVKKLRAEAKKSLVDVSGAVEIDLEQLKRIESGTEKPSEELVVLLISHFALHEKDAHNFWKLAGYNENEDVIASQANNSATQVVLPIGDARVVYTDMVNVSANNYGVVINFLQGLGTNNQPLAVSRVGMSLEHAASFLRVLSDTVDQVAAQKNEQAKHTSKENTDSSENKADTSS